MREMTLSEQIDNHIGRARTTAACSLLTLFIDIGLRQCQN